MNPSRARSIRTPSPIARAVATLCALLLTCAAWAETAAPPTVAGPTALQNTRPSHIAAAKDVLELLRVRDSIPPLAAQIAALVSAQIEQWNPPPEAQPEVDKTVARIQAAVAEEIDWSTMETDYLVLYTETFDERELREIARFFRSPIGAKYVASAPQLQQRALVVGELRFARVQPRIELLLGDLKRHLDVLELERESRAGAGGTNGAAAQPTP